MKAFLPFLFLFISFTVLAQEQDARCATGLLFNHEYYKQSQAAIQKLRNGIANARLEANDDVLIIPVVVHVIYRTSTEKITIENVKEQIRILNEDYRRHNADTAKAPLVFRKLAGDAGIEFRLALQDPNGLYTEGVTYTQTTQTVFSIYEDRMKFFSQGGHDAWDPTSYLNLWVCNFESGYIGVFNGNIFSPGPTDGVAVASRVFGRNTNKTYGLGRTATHEIGHYLGLSHVWGPDERGHCQSDDVDDTPFQDSSTPTGLDCPVFPYNPNVCTQIDTLGHMFPNYMDYARDACMNMFTKGQIARMRNVLLQPRSSLLRSHGLKSPFLKDLALTQLITDTAQACGNTTGVVKVKVANGGTDTIRSYDLEMDVNGEKTSYSASTALLPGRDTLWTITSGAFVTEGANRISLKGLVSGDEYFANDTLGFTFKCNSPLTIYPNPAEKTLFIKGNDPQFKSITFYSMAGKEMLKVLKSPEVDISSLSAGVYLVVLETETGTIRKQLIVL